MKTYAFISVQIFILILSVLGKAEGAEGGYRSLWGGFSTSLAGRSSMQILNAGRAARDLDGIILPPGETFSFNAHVGSRDSGKGYVKAPMINDAGYLQDTTGGGICQLATTIYNAALYAGLDIAERHPHSRAVSYVPPGRDATIASWRKDLKLHNPYMAPLVLRITMKDQRLTASFWSTENKPFKVELHTDSMPLEPETATGESAGVAGLRGQTGGRGFSVITWRTVRMGELVREQILSRDFYPPPSRILRGEEP